MWRTASHLRARRSPISIVLVDFGAFNMRLAKRLRGRLKYRGPILDFFPPGDVARQAEQIARAVSAMTVPLTAFEHQYAFLQSRSKLPIVYFGHPLAGAVRDAAAARAGAAADGGTRRAAAGQPERGTALSFAGARRARIAQLQSAASASARVVRRRRRARRADDPRERSQRERLADATVVRGVREARRRCRRGVGRVGNGRAGSGACSACRAVALYIITPMLVRHGRSA